MLYFEVGNWALEAGIGGDGGSMRVGIDMVEEGAVNGPLAIAPPSSLLVLLLVLLDTGERGRVLSLVSGDNELGLRTFSGLSVGIASVVDFAGVPRELVEVFLLLRFSTNKVLRTISGSLFLAR